MLLPVFSYSRASTQPVMGCEITGSHFDKREDPLRELLLCCKIIWDAT